MTEYNVKSKKFFYGKSLHEPEKSNKFLVQCVLSAVFFYTNLNVFWLNEKQSWKKSKTFQNHPGI